MTILDLDIKGLLSKLEKRYRVKLPRSVVALEYGEKDDLYVRFKHVDNPLSEPSKDGLVIFFFEDGGTKPVAVEILDVNKLARK